MLAHGVSRGARTCSREPLEGAKGTLFRPFQGLCSGLDFPRAHAVG